MIIQVVDTTKIISLLTSSSEEVSADEQEKESEQEDNQSEDEDNIMFYF